MNNSTEIWPNQIPQPKEPIRVALVGTGNRSQTVYMPLFQFLKPYFKLVAVCDPVKANCDAAAELLGVPAWYDLRQLVKDRPMEAAITITPVDAHHAISVYLSEHGIHNTCETSFAATLTQAREMVAAAEKHGVVMRVAENFIRLPEFRLAAAVRDSGLIGPIRRVVSYAAHTGYHNNSVWIHFAGKKMPEWVQSIDHTMPTTPFNSLPQRRHVDEHYTARYYQFPDNILVMDHAANVKGFLGRLSRPGYCEWQGARGTLAQGSIGYGGRSVAEVRRLSDDMVRRGEAGEQGTGGADEIWPVVHENSDKHAWLRSYVDGAPMPVEYRNPFRPPVKLKCYPDMDWIFPPLYAGAQMDILTDFALAVRGLRPSEYLPEHALWAMMMEVAARESVLQEGRRIRLPLEGVPESDVLNEQRIRKTYGVEPTDIEGMLAVSYPKP
jgi:hypothetical protein